MVISPNVTETKYAQAAVDVQRQEEMAGAGAIPGYIPNIEPAVFGDINFDFVDLSALPSAAAAAPLTQGTTPVKFDQLRYSYQQISNQARKLVNQAKERGFYSEFKTYLENETRYLRLLNLIRQETKAPVLNSPPPAPPPPPQSPPPPSGVDHLEKKDKHKSSSSDESEGPSGPGGGGSGGGGGGGDIIDIINFIDMSIWGQLLGTNYDDYSEEFEGGYDTLSPEFKAWMKKLMRAINVLTCILSALSLRFSARLIAEEAFSGNKAEDNKFSARRVFERQIGALVKIFTSILTAMVQQINTHNQEVYEANHGSMEDMDLKNLDEGDIAELGEKIGETIEYLQATVDMLTEVKSLLATLISEMLLGMTGSQELDESNLAMIRALVKFQKKVDSIMNELKGTLEKLEEVKEKIDDYLEDIDDKKNGGSGIFGSIWNFYGELIRAIKDVLGGDFKGAWGHLNEALDEIGELGSLVTWDQTWVCLSDIFDNIWLGWIFDIQRELTTKLWKTILEFVPTLIDYAIFRWTNWLLKQTGLSENGWGFDFQHEWNKFWDSIREMMKGLVNNWLVDSLFSSLITDLANYLSPPFIDIARGLEYIEDFDPEELLADFRGDIVKAQNSRRAALALMYNLFDLVNVAREKFGLSGLDNDAEIVMRANEASMGATLSAADSVTNQLMNSVSMINTLKQMLDTLEAMSKAMPLFQLSSVLKTISNITATIASVLAVCSLFANVVPLFGQIACAVGETVALVCAIISIVSSILSSICSAAGNAMMAGSRDNYHPADPSTDTNFYGSGPVGDMDEAMQNNRAGAVNDNGLIEQTKDGFYKFNAYAWAAYEARQTAIANCIRMILSLIQNTMDLQRTADVEFTGHSVKNTGGTMISNMVDAIMNQQAVILQAIKYQYMQVVQAKNTAKANEVEWNKLITKISIQISADIVGAVAGYFLPGIGKGISAGLQAALGALIVNSLVEVGFELFWSMYGPDSALGMEYDPSSMDLENSIRARGDQTTEGRLEQAEYEVYMDLINNGIAQTGGSSYGSRTFGVNFSMVSKAYQRLMLIYNLKEALIKARALGSELHSIAKQEFTGISLGKYGDLSMQVNNANAQLAFSIVKNIVSTLSDIAQVKTQAHAVRGQVNMLTNQFVVSAACASAYFILGGVAKGLSMATEPATAAINGIAKAMSVLPGLMSLNNAIWSTQNAYFQTQGGLGEYENYNANNDVKDKSPAKRHGASNVDQALDALEAELYSEMGTNLIETVSGSTVGVSPLAAKLTGRLQALYYIKECLALARSLSREVMNEAKMTMTGKTAGVSDYGMTALERQKQGAMAIMDSLESAVQLIADRRNQLTKANKALIENSVSLAISAASLILQVIQTVKQIQLIKEEADLKVDVKNMQTELKTLKNNQNAIDPSIQTNQDISAAAEKLNQAQAKVEINQQAQTELRHGGLQVAQEALTMANLLFKYTFAASYDRYQETHHHEKAHGTDRTKGLDAKGSGTQGAFAFLNTAEAAQIAAQYHTAVNKSEIQKELLVDEKFWELNDKLTEMALGAIKTAGDQADHYDAYKVMMERPVSLDEAGPAQEQYNNGIGHSLRILSDNQPITLDEANNIFGESSPRQRLMMIRQRAEELERDENLSPQVKAVKLRQLAALAAAALPAQYLQGPAGRPVIFVQEDSRPPSSRALLEQADSIEQQMQAVDQTTQQRRAEMAAMRQEIKVLKKRIQQVMASQGADRQVSIEQLEARIAELEAKIEAKLTEITQLNEQLANLQAEAATVRTQIEQLRGQAGQPSAFEVELSAQLTFLDEQIARLEAQGRTGALSEDQTRELNSLHFQREAVQYKLKQAAADREMSRQAVDHLERRHASLVAADSPEIAAIKQKIKLAQGEIKQLQSELNSVISEYETRRNEGRREGEPRFEYHRSARPNGTSRLAEAPVQPRPATPQPAREPRTTGEMSRGGRIARVFMYLGNPLLGLAYDYIYKKINPETALEDHSDILNELKLRKFSDPSVSGPGGAVEDFMLRDVTQREQVALLAKLAKTEPQKAATLALYVVVTDQLDENAPAYKLLKKLIKKLNLAQREAAIEDTVRLIGAKKARELAARIALSMGVTLETVNKIINRVFPPEAAAQQQEEMTPPPIAEPPAAPPPNHVDTTPGYYTYANAGEAVYGPTARFGRRPSL